LVFIGENKMADKKISALAAVSDSSITADDLLHIVENPGGTPVNKKMTIGQLFENIPTHLAIDDITTVTAASSTLATSFATAIDLSGATANVQFTLGSGTNVGQIKVIWAATEPAASWNANIQVTSFGPSASAATNIVLSTIGESVVLIWSGTHWFPIADSGLTASRPAIT